MAGEAANLDAIAYTPISASLWVCVCVCSHYSICAFCFISNMGKNERFDQFPYDRCRAGERVFSTPTGFFKQQHRFCLNGREQDFLLWEIKKVSDLKGPKGGHRKGRDQRREVQYCRYRKEREWRKGSRGEEEREHMKGKGRDCNERKRTYCHMCECLPTHILRVSEQLETLSKGWLWETKDKQGSQELKHMMSYTVLLNRYTRESWKSISVLQCWKSSDTLRKHYPLILPCHTISSKVVLIMQIGLI